MEQINIVKMIKEAKPEKIYNSSDLFIAKSLKMIEEVKKLINQNNETFFNKINLKKAFSILSLLDSELDKRIEERYYDVHQLKDLKAEVQKLKHEVVNSLFEIELQKVNKIQENRHKK